MYTGNQCLKKALWNYSDEVGIEEELDLWILRDKCWSIAGAVFPIER